MSFVLVPFGIHSYEAIGVTIKRVGLVLVVAEQGHLPRICVLYCLPFLSEC